MQLINEEDYLAFGLFNFVQNGFQTLLKFAPELSARNKSTHIKGEELPVFKIVGNISTDDTLCQTLCNGSFTDTGFTDKNGVVLGLTGQDTDSVSYLAVTADNRVKLVLTGKLHKVLTVLFKHIIGVLGSIGGNTLVASYLLKSLQEAVLVNGKVFEYLFDVLVSVVKVGEHNVLYGYKFIAHVLGNGFGGIEQSVKGLGDINGVHITSATRYLGYICHNTLKAACNNGCVLAQLFHQLRDKTVFLSHQRIKQMRLVNVGVLVLNSGILCSLNGFYSLFGKFLHIHKIHLPFRR